MLFAWRLKYLPALLRSLFLFVLRLLCGPLTLYSPHKKVCYIQKYLLSPIFFLQSLQNVLITQLILLDSQMEAI